MRPRGALVHPGRRHRTAGLRVLEKRSDLARAREQFYVRHHHGVQQ
jgi:hypothetical protein